MCLLRIHVQGPCGTRGLVWSATPAPVGLQMQPVDRGSSLPFPFLLPCALLSFIRSCACLPSFLSFGLSFVCTCSFIITAAPSSLVIARRQRRYTSMSGSTSWSPLTLACCQQQSLLPIRPRAAAGGPHFCQAKNLHEQNTDPRRRHFCYKKGP